MKIRSAVPLLSLVALAAAPLLAVADMPVGGAVAGESRYAGATARTVRALIDYTQWPARPDPLLLCVAGPARHAAQLGAMRLSDGRRVERRNVGTAPGGLSACHVVYLGPAPLPAQRALTAAVRGRGVLTIAEADPDNASEAMFVLVYAADALSFRLNLDAVSRSGLKVDPRVLRIASGALTP